MSSELGNRHQVDLNLWAKQGPQAVPLVASVVIVASNCLVTKLWRIQVVVATPV